MTTLLLLLLSSSPSSSAATTIFSSDTTTAFWSVVLPYGLTCLTSHIVLVSIFKYVLPSSSPASSSSSSSFSSSTASSPSPLPPWKTVPSFTAHQVIALYLMISWTVSGIHYYYYDHDNDGTTPIPNGGNSDLKLFQIHNGGLLMAQRSMAALWIWDIPVMTFGIKKSPTDNSHADLIMHLHHVGMLIICCIMLGLMSYDEEDNADNDQDSGDDTSSWHPVPIGSCYAPVFLGIVELSSIPLQIVDLFHPHKGQGHWYKYINSGGVIDNRQGDKNGSDNNEHKFKSMLRNLNELCRQLFALLFLLVRGIYFPYVVIGDVVPNILKAFRTVYPKYLVPLGITFVFSVGFTLLQMYWTVLVVQQVMKALNLTKSPSPSTSKAKNATVANVSNEDNDDTEAKKSK